MARIFAQPNPLICEHCGTPERYFDIRVVADILPCSYDTLRTALGRYKDQLAPATYRWAGNPRCRVRVMSATDLLTLRQIQHNKAAKKPRKVKPNVSEA